MKKRSIFLAALLFFTAAAVTPGNVQEVQAYSRSELGEAADVESYNSSKAGATVSFTGGTKVEGIYVSWSDTLEENDLTGAKLALCKVDNQSLDEAVAVWDLSNDDRKVDEFNKSIIIKKSVTLETDILEGEYTKIIFNSKGRKIYIQDCKFLDKYQLDFEFALLDGDDEYVYASIFSDDVKLPEGVLLDESYCPVLYDVDQQTALTAYDDLLVYNYPWYHNNYPGKTVYYYRLKVLDASRISSGYGGEGACYKNVDSEVIEGSMNENGMAWASIWNRSSMTYPSNFKNLFGNGNTQNPDNTPSNDASDSTSLTGKSRFVTLLYENVLERSATESEIANWVQELENGKSGADTASGFIFSEEFTNKNLSNSEYVERLYQSMMGRASDEGGKSDWVAHLENGVSRLYVFKQFVNSQEFAKLCEEYAIVQGDAELSEARDVNYEVTRFVARNYKEFLGRAYDEAGMNDWTSRINNHEQTMQEIASGFVFSQECTDQNLSDEAYVQMLYRGCFDRAGDADGVADWVSKLADGSYNREEVFLGFANSQEFANMVSNYGL